MYVDDKKAVSPTMAHKKQRTKNRYAVDVYD